MKMFGFNPHPMQPLSRLKASTKVSQAIMSLAVLSLVSSVTLVPMANLEAFAQYGDNGTSMDHIIDVPGGENLTNIDASNASVRDLLRSLSMEAGFNLVLDESVTGNISLNLSGVTVNEALRSILSMTGMEMYPKKGNIYLVVSRDAAKEKGLSYQYSKIIQVKNSNAVRVATMLNLSLFSDPNSQSTNVQSLTMGRVKPDARTNSIIVVGTKREIELAEAAVEQLDRVRESKTFYLSNANAVDIASLLSSSVFNDGMNPLNITGAGGGGGGAGGSQQNQNPLLQLFQPTTVRADQETIAEGSGINNFGGSSASSGGAPGPLSQQVQLRGVVKATSGVQISPLGPIVIPDTRNNSITIMGTKEQIEMAEKVIPVFDAQLPQVSIEASLVEITESGVRELNSNIGIADGKMSVGFNNQPTTGADPTVNSGVVGLPTNDPTDTNAFARSGIVLTNRPVLQPQDYLFQLRSLITKNRAKILANPTVIASHDTEAIISIVDEIVRRTTVQLDAQTGTVQITNELGEVGVVLDILPKIGEDGTVTLRVRPSVSTVSQVTTDAAGNIITLLSKRDLLSQSVRIKDGETLVLGGLIDQRETNRMDKLPIIGELPIVGAFFRSSQRGTDRSEVVILITPHIINKTKTHPIYAVQTMGGK